MIPWTKEQRDAIWKQYLDGKSFALIAERYGHLGATRKSIAGVIYRIQQARKEEVDAELEDKKGKARYQRRTGTYGGYDTKRKNPPLTQEEIKSIKEARKK